MSDAPRIQLDGSAPGDTAMPPPALARALSGMRLARDPSPRNIWLGRMSARIRSSRVAVGALIALAVLLLPPWIVSKETFAALGFSENNVNLFRATMVEIAIFAIAALGLNILVGYCGLLNLGFAGFMCIGAYTAAILMKEHGWGYVPACLAAIAHGALWGIILGLPTLHLTGDYFAIVTFGFAELVLLAARNNIFGLTGGAAGYPDVPDASLNFGFLHSLGFGAGPESFLFEADPRQNAYGWYFAASWLLLAALSARFISRSRLGRAWRAIQADELAAQSCAINTRWYKTLAFAFAAGLGGLAGAIYACHLRNVSFHNYAFLVSVYVLVYLVLGGMGTIVGTILGSALLISALEGLRALLTDVLPNQYPALKNIEFLADLRHLFYGVILVVFIRFRPEGIVSSTRVARELHPNDLERHHEDVGYDDIRKERQRPEPNK